MDYTDGIGDLRHSGRPLRSGPRLTFSAGLQVALCADRISLYSRPVEKDSIWESTVAVDPEPLDEAPPIPWDAQENRTMLCRRCHLPRVFRRRRIQHSFHFMLALGTIGLWLPVWGVMILLQFYRPWSCSVCGIHQRK